MIDTLHLLDPPYPDCQPLADLLQCVRVDGADQAFDSGNGHHVRMTKSDDAGES
ncbi:MAG: hypothetical protein GFGODING_01121 [Flavobacteriales bacterium]|nr:hypothetical protein [Flavobacteriales bacterium]